MTIVRNRADLLEPAAQSVLAQTDGDLELVILDDGSTDDTWPVAQRIAASDERVRLLRNERPRGIPAARNEVLAAARGRYVAICDSDDESRPERFARSRAVLDADARLAAVGVRINAFATHPREGVEPGWHWGLEDGRLPFAFCGAMLRTEALRAAGGFDERYPLAEDLHLAYRLAGAGARFAIVDAVLLDYRLHDGSITASRVRTRRWCTLRAQLRGIRELRGRLSARGYLVLGQSVLYVALGAVGLHGVRLSLPRKVAVAHTRVRA